MKGISRSGDEYKCKIQVGREKNEVFAEIRIEFPTEEQADESLDELGDIINEEIGKAAIRVGKRIKKTKA